MFLRFGFLPDFFLLLFPEYILDFFRIFLGFLPEKVEPAAEFAAAEPEYSLEATGLTFAV